MSKKKAKSSPPIKLLPINNINPWIDDLKSKDINDENFKCEVSILIEPKPFYRQIAEEFGKFCHYGYRKFIKCISVDVISEYVFTHCSKNGEITPLSMLCDEILKKTGKFFDGKIPLDLYSYLIKYIILDYKNKNILEKNIEILKENELQSLLNQYNKTTGIGTKKGSKQTAASAMKSAKKTGQKSAKKTGQKSEKKTGQKSAKKDKSSETNKPLSELNTRYENLKCLENLKDQPENCPNLFIVILQSRNSELPLSLTKMMIPVTSLIQIGNVDKSSFDDNESFQNLLEKNRNKNKEIEEIISKSYLDKSKYKSFIEESDVRTYWNSILYYMNHKEYFNSFKDIIILRCNPDIPQDPKSPNFIDKLRRSVYDSVTSTLYESVILRQMHQTYLNDLNMIEVNLKDNTKIKELEYYNKVMENIPLETTSVALILDTLISQVCLDNDYHIGYETDHFKFLTEDSEMKMPNVPPQTCIDKLIEQLTIKNRFSDYNLNFNSNNVNERVNRNKNCSKVYNCGDRITESILYLDDDLKQFVSERTRYIQILFWDTLFFSKSESNNLLKNVYNKLKNEGLNDPIRSEIIDVFISLFQYQKDFNNNSLKNVKNYQTYIKEIIEKTSNKFILKNYPDNCSTFSLIPNDIITVLLEDMFIESSHYEIKYNVLTDKTLIIFSDRKIPLVNSFELPTCYSLRDYVEVISKNNNFKTDKIFIENKKRFNYTDMLNDQINSSIINLKEDSQFCNISKYHGETDEWLELYYEETFEKYSKYKYFLQYDKNDKKLDKNVINNKKLLYDIGVEGKINFNFYDMNIKLNEQLEIYLHYLEEIKLYKYLLNLVTKIKKHEIHYRTNILPQGFKISEKDKRNPKLFIRHSSGIILTIRKTTLNSKNGRLNVTHEFKDFEFPELGFLKFNNLKPDDNFNENNFEVNITWPNGLTIQQMNRPKAPVYIKQKYIHKKPSNFDITDELYRCYLYDGTVIKFMKHNLFIVFYGNGKIITCYKCESMKSDDNSQTHLSDNKNVSKITHEFSNNDALKLIGNLTKNELITTKDLLTKKESKITKDLFKKESETTKDSINIKSSMAGVNLSTRDQSKNVIHLDDYEEDIVKDSISETNLLLEYDVRRQDGIIYSFYNGMIDHKESLFVEYFQNVQENSIKAEFSDGVTYIYSDDCSLTIHHTDGTVVTCYSRFSSNEIYIEDEKDSDNNKKENEFLDFLSAFEIKEPFVSIELSYKIDHPNFASVVFSYDNFQSVVTMQDRIQIKFSNDININFNDEIDISTVNENISVSEFNNDKIRNNVIYSFKNFSERSIPNDIEPCVSYFDYFNNSVKIYDNGKFEINDRKPIDNKQNEHILIIDKNYNGIEILSKYQKNQYILKYLKENKEAIIREFRTKESVDFLLINPTNCNKWLHFNNFINIKKDKQKLSTYGENWYYPFKNNTVNNKKLPETLCIKYFKEITKVPEIIEDIRNTLTIFSDNLLNCELKFNSICSTNSNELFQPVQKLIENKELFHMFKKNSIKLEKECKMDEIYNYFKNKLADKVVQKINFKNIESYADRYQIDRFYLLNKSILPYYENAEGIVNYIINEIIDGVYLSSSYEKELHYLLFKSLTEITDKDIESIKYLLIKLNRIEDKESVVYAFEKVLRAGKTLDRYFSNINQLLDFHRMVKLNITTDKKT